MNRLVILCAVFLSIVALVVAACPHGSETNEFLQEGSFESRVDHFRPRDNRTFTYTYCSNTRYYQDAGPVFVFIGDGYDHSTRWIEEGLMVDLARELHGVLIQADHRYFGENIPTETASLDDLQHFNVENSLSDIAYLITAVKDHLNSPYARVIVWGSGVGAKLAVWSRQKFPHLIHGAWSSSGLFQADPISPSFYNLLSWNIHTISVECEYKVEEIFQTMHTMIQNGEAAELQEQLHLCNPIDASSPSDIAMFIEGHINYITRFIDDHHLSGLQGFCRDINVIPAEAVRSYARWFLFTYDVNGECFDLSYASFVEAARTESWNEPGTLSGLRQYRYAQCTQLGYMKVTSPNGIFPNVITADYHYGLCEDIFGESYDRLAIQEASRALDIQYGSRNQQSGNVVYTNGMLDPWIDHAITDDNILNSRVININYLSVSGDLESIAGWQSAEVRQAKELIMNLITRWVHGYTTVPYAMEEVAPIV